MHSRLAKKSEKGEKTETHEVCRGFAFSTDFSKMLSWNILTHKCTKVRNPCACAVKWGFLRRQSFRSGQTLSPAWSCVYVLPIKNYTRYHKIPPTPDPRSYRYLPQYQRQDSTFQIAWASLADLSFLPCQRLGCLWVVKAVDFGGNKPQRWG